MNLMDIDNLEAIDKQKQHNVVRLLSLALFIDFIALIFILVIRDDNYPVLFQIATVFIVASIQLFALSKARQGKYQIALYIFLAAAFIGTGTVSILVAGSSPLVTLVHFLSAFITLFFIGRKKALQYLLIAFFSHLLIAQAQRFGLLPQPESMLSSYYLNQTIIFFIIVVCSFLYFQITRADTLVEELNETLGKLSQAQQNLSTREQLFSELFNNSPISALIQEFKDGKLATNLANSAFFEGKNYSSFEAFQQIDPVHFQEVVYDQLEEILAVGKDRFIFEVDVSMPGGDTQIVEIHASVERDEQGQLVRIIRQGAYVTEERKFKHALLETNEALKNNQHQLLQSNRDLKSTLEELKNTQETLKQRDALFSNFFQNTPVATAIFPVGVSPADFDETNLRINSACATFFGFNSIEEAYQLRDTDLERFSFMFSVPRLEESIEQGIDNLYSLDQHTKQNGEPFWADVYQYVERDADGNPTRFVVQGLDVTDRVAHQELLEARVKSRTADLQKANDALEVASQRKDEFLAMMSHELRTPLNTILARVQALQWGVYGKLSAKQLETLTGIESSGGHLLNLIQDILDVSKIAAGEMTVDFTDVDVTKVCTESINSVRTLASKKSQALVLNFQHMRNIIEADEIKLRQILDNLLSNAIKFTPENKQIGLTVTESNKDEIVFTVWDEGIGIAEDKQSLLFQPFLQIDSRLSRQYEGTGLGLSLVKQLAEIHGGSVRLESETDKGSRFIVTIPYKPKSLPSQTTISHTNIENPTDLSLNLDQ